MSIKITFEMDVHNKSFLDLRLSDIAKILDLMTKVVHAPNLSDAHHLEWYGIRVLADERFTPAGGTLEHIGYTDCVDQKDISNYEYLNEMSYEVGGILPVMKVYRGPVEYLIALPVGNEEDDVEYELELKATFEEAEALIEKFYPEDVSK